MAEHCRKLERAWSRGTMDALQASMAASQGPVVASVKEVGWWVSGLLGQDAFFGGCWWSLGWWA
jgi:hypothetical protein